MLYFEAIAYNNSFTQLPYQRNPYASDRVRLLGATLMNPAIYIMVNKATAATTETTTLNMMLTSCLTVLGSYKAELLDEVDRLGWEGRQLSRPQ
jgi:hypothetical protein